MTQLSLKQMLIIIIDHWYTIINDILSVARVEKIVDIGQRSSYNRCDFNNWRSAVIQ